VTDKPQAGRFRGAVEQAYRDLRECGYGPREAREGAPRLAELREANRDREVAPYSWLGAPARSN
jgi:hypothetical protein